MYRSAGTYRNSRIYPGSSCQRFVKRREMLQQVLQDQIVIAEQLEISEGRYSRDAAYAWDVVEEISRKIRIVDMHIDDCLYEDKGYEKAMRDDEIADRMYDL